MQWVQDSDKVGAVTSMRSDVDPDHPRQGSHNGNQQTSFDDNDNWIKHEEYRVFFTLVYILAWQWFLHIQPEGWSAGGKVGAVPEFILSFQNW